MTQPAELKISVVICSVDRARALRRTLAALRHQVHPSFEVVVVAAPSRDATDRVLAQHSESIRVVRNDCIHLSRSRNLGIEAAAGELVAFLDDDAIPDPGWLTALASAFDVPGSVGAGGFVRDADGTRYQYRYSLCSRSGHATQRAEPATAAHVRAHADPFLYLQGTNACFRRDALCAVGGFDEEIEFFHDETDLCARLLDGGGILRVVTGADVIHKYEESRIRDAQGRVRDPFPIVKNRVYFAYRHAGARIGTPQLEQELARFADIWRAQERDLCRRGAISAQERDRTLRRIEEALAAGRHAARDSDRRTKSIGPQDEARFLPFPRASRGCRRRVVFVSSEFPPGDFGGIGRFSQDLAGGLAELGWEAHVVVPDATPPPLPVPEPPSPHPTVIDFDQGAWVHRVPRTVRAPRLAGSASHSPLERAAAAYHEISVIEERFGAVDVVSAPVWSGDGLVISLDRRRAVVTTLMTTLRRVVSLQPSWQGREVESLLALEAETLRRSSDFHAISAAIYDSVRRDYPVQSAGVEARVLRLGIRDRRGSFQRRARPSARRTRILFVGRLERRKGVDLLLAAADALLQRRSDVEFVLVGRDTPNTELGVTYRQHFNDVHRESPAVLEHVTFAGAVPETDLYQHYADADIFAAPSRYESFGLVHVEAMMMSLPVVACATGGLTEVVRPGETGLLVAPDDGAALERALDEMLDDPELRRRMGHEGRKRYESEFALDVAAARTATAYAHIASRRPQAADARVEIARALADSIERVTREPAHVARRAADELLAPATVSPLELVARVWDAGAEAFVDALYAGLLQRAPNNDERAQLLARLQADTHRGELVREVGWSPEASARELEPSWLGELLSLPGWTEELACAAAFSQHRGERFAQDITDLLLVDPLERDGARARVVAELARGVPRLSAALGLLHADFTLRNAPDFAGWEPMLHHFACAHQEPAPLQSASTSATPSRPRVTKRLRSPTARPVSLARDAIQAIRVTRDRSAAIAEAIGRVEAQLRDQQAVIDGLSRRLDGFSDGLGNSTGDIYRLLGEVHASVGRVEDHAAIRAENVDTRLNDVVSALHVSGQRTDILQTKLSALAIDLRDRLPTQPPAAELPEPVIRDEARVRALRDSEEQSLKVNLGAGEKPVEGYLNVDMRPLPRIDVVADVRRLPFEPGSLDELMSAHLVEHFRANVLEVVLLPYWRSLLRPDGVLRIICPNWAAITRRLAAGELGWNDFKVLTFGLQDYEGDDHFSMYTPEMLRELLRRAGFAEVKVVTEERINGMCPEMELTARPADPPHSAREEAAAIVEAP